MGKKLTDEEFKTKLKKINPFLEVIDEYQSTTTKIRFKCLKDGYIFETKPGYILSDNTGCPLCSGNVVVNGMNDLWTTHP